MIEPPKGASISDFCCHRNLILNVCYQWWKFRRLNEVLILNAHAFILKFHPKSSVHLLRSRGLSLKGFSHSEESSLVANDALSCRDRKTIVIGLFTSICLL